ncbi:MAG: hypothetical protein ACK55Z_25120, partial [bacterium]
MTLGLGPQTKPFSMTTHHGLVTSHPATWSFSGVGDLCICMCVDVRTGYGSAELPRRCRRRASAELLGRKPPCRSKRGHSKVGGQDRAQDDESA